MDARRAVLAEIVAEVSAACEAVGVDGYDGEAVAYLDALLTVADEPGTSARDAVSRAYGLDA